MSFLSILKTIGKDFLAVEKVAAPIASVAFPQFAGAINLVDNFVQKVQGTIVTIEANNPVDGQGQLKSASVINDFVSGLELTQSMLALDHKKLTFDQTKLQAAIDAQVAAYNNFAALKASFKVEPIS